MTHLVGAYAAVAKGLDAHDQDRVYEALHSHPLVGALEMPFNGRWSDAEIAHVAEQVGPAADVVMTTIPGLYRIGLEDGTFGPASPDPIGRRRAVSFLREAWESSRRLGEVIGQERVIGFSVTSSPRRASVHESAGADSFARSLGEMLTWEWGATRLTVEHCDALTNYRKPAKGYLPIDDELRAIRLVGADSDSRIGLGINWGRSAIEGRGSETAFSHTRIAARAGLLSQLVFSGCSAQRTVFGPAWADSHLPSAREEPTCLLGVDAMEECLGLIRNLPSPMISGLKVTAPAEWSAAERISFLNRELQLLDDVSRVSAS